MPLHGRGLNEFLLDKLLGSLKNKTGIRNNRVVDVFERTLYIPPDSIEVENYLRRKPLAAFNPGAIIMGDKLLVFPRLVFDYYWYVSSIGVFELGMDEVIDQHNILTRKVKAKIILYPSEPWELARGCEDPRVVFHNDSFHVLYTAVAALSLEQAMKSLQGYAVLDREFNVAGKKYFRLKWSDGEHVPYSWKDSAFLEINKDRALMLIRPTLESRFGLLEVVWRGEASLSEAIVDADTVEPVLLFEKWEFKVGLSTNALKISSNEYLVGWHGVQNIDKRYLNGLAIVDSDGNLKAITNYLLEPTRIEEYYGDRPGVIFGDGLAVYKDLVIWVGGVADQMIGIFVASLDKVLESMLWIKKR